MRTIPGMTVINPSDDIEAKAAEIRIQYYQIVVLFAQLYQRVSVAVSGCNLLYFWHNASPFLCDVCSGQSV